MRRLSSSPINSPVGEVLIDGLRHTIQQAWQVLGQDEVQMDGGGTHEGDLDQAEIPLRALLARNRTEELPPPARSEFSLPFDKLSPPMFERLVAETVWLVDGLNPIRIYGRSGQDQGGLDLIGYQGTDLHVYQVRRIDKLTPSKLRKAVTDFTDPKPPKGSKGKKPSRRFDAQRFVLVTACTVDDRHVEDELVELKRKYAGDIEIDLYDGQELLRKLMNRGALILSIFGPEWAKAVCGHEAPDNPETPDGRLLLNDPIEMLGLGSLRAEAEAMEATSPSEAAQLFGQLSKALYDKRFAPYGRIWKARQRDALRAASNAASAFTVAMELLIDLYEAGQHVHSEAQVVSTLADALDARAVDAAVIAAALDDWPEYGYELAPVSDALRNLVEANHAFAGQLVVLIAEQIVTDDDPRDDFTLLLDVANAIVGKLSDKTHRTRLRCCIADLQVHAGADPIVAFADLTRDAQGGWLSASLDALALRRAARALAFAGKAEDAIAMYRRAVIDAAAADHGGDARDALRSIAHIADRFETRNDPFRSSRVIGTRARLLQGSDDAALVAMESLIDNKLADAHRSAHHWVRHERISGSLFDEAVARKRHGDVFARADMPAQAVRQYVLAGARKEAVSAARNTSEPLDVSMYLTARFPTWVHAGAAAVCTVQADLIPDDRVLATAMALLTIIESEVPRSIFRPDPVKYGVGALAALEWRLPVEAAQRLLPRMLNLIPREAGHYRFVDDEMLSFFSTCVQLPDDATASTGARALLRCAQLNIHNADIQLFSMGTHRDAVLDEIQELARSGNDLAVQTLAAWQFATDEVVAVAREAASQLLDQPVGHARNSWGVGGNLGRQIILLHTALAPERIAIEPDLADLGDRVVLHLLARAKDHHDIAPNRSEALRALRGVADRVPESLRSEVCAQLIALHDDPQLNEEDLHHQQSLHPLSRGRMNLGSERLGAEALHTASIYADEPSEAHAIYERLQPALYSALSDQVDAMHRGDTLIHVARMVSITPDFLVTHPAAHIRQAAIVCWTRQDDRNPVLAQIFAEDVNRGVRNNLARYLAGIHNPTGMLAELLHKLKSDPNALVRRTARGQETSG